MRELGISRDLFKMAANLHIMSYTYSDTTYFFSKMEAFSYLHHYMLFPTCSCIDPLLPLQPHSPHTIPQHPYTANDVKHLCM